MNKVYIGVKKGEGCSGCEKKRMEKSKDMKKCKLVCGSIAIIVTSFPFHIFSSYCPHTLSTQ